MTSSTSSSRRIYAVSLLVILGGMGLAAGSVLGFSYLVGARPEAILDRVLQARAALPRIIEQEEPLVMAFGSSMTEAGFSPRRFDRRLGERGIEVKSYNFGFGGLNPFFQDYFSRRIRDEFVANDRRLKFAMIEFTPLQNTQARWRGAEPLVESYITMLATDREIWELALENPTRGIRVANIHYIRGDISAEMVTWAIGDEWFGSSRPDSGLEEDPEQQARVREMSERFNAAFEEDYPDYDYSVDWNFEWQGGGTIPVERSPETVQLLRDLYDELRTEKHMADDRLWRIACCDIEELRFEETLIAAFIRTVQNFQEFSDHVEVVLLPRNSDWIARQPDAEERLRIVLERIERETGVTIRSFEDAPEITPDMYSDTTHLTRYHGDVAFTDLLVDAYEELLRD